MADFKNILVAVDVSNEASTVLKKAIDISVKFNSKISVLHVVEPVIIDPAIELTPIFSNDIETALVDRANNFLAEEIKKYDKYNIEFRVLLGSIKRTVHQEAIDSSADLIVVGTHGRHGIGRLLGSTASAVLHGAPCDVLIVKIA